MGKTIAVATGNSYVLQAGDPKPRSLALTCWACNPQEERR